MSASDLVPSIPSMANLNLDIEQPSECFIDKLPNELVREIADRVAIDNNPNNHAAPRRTSPDILTFRLVSKRFADAGSKTLLSSVKRVYYEASSKSTDLLHAICDHPDYQKAVNELAFIGRRLRLYPNYATFCRPVGRMGWEEREAWRKAYRSYAARCGEQDSLLVGAGHMALHDDIRKLSNVTKAAYLSCFDTQGFNVEAKLASLKYPFFKDTLKESHTGDKMYYHFIEQGMGMGGAPWAFHFTPVDHFFIWSSYFRQLSIPCNWVQSHACTLFGNLTSLEIHWYIGAAAEADMSPWTEMLTAAPLLEHIKLRSYVSYNHMEQVPSNTIYTSSWHNNLFTGLLSHSKFPALRSLDLGDDPGRQMSLRDFADLIAFFRRHQATLRHVSLHGLLTQEVWLLTQDRTTLSSTLAQRDLSHDELLEELAEGPDPTLPWLDLFNVMRGELKLEKVSIFLWFPVSSDHRDLAMQCGAVGTAGQHPERLDFGPYVLSSKKEE
ncbi:hypothetical protein H2203_007984 [Taxawa tesnikishii (nom. ined.)]|nr:hypothetical protein H2203_007984 [Dothideales sp. JES 119]